MISQGNVEQYWIKSEKYYNNALKHAAHGEFTKASELLWGAVTQSLRALATMRGIYIRSHKGYSSLTFLLSQELKDREFHKTFKFLEDLHENFYEEKIDPKEFPIYREAAEDFLKKTKEIAKRIEKKNDLKMCGKM
ncbi:MAG: PaREP1/PaREP8 domain-containing protein [Methanomicrobia archaeon]|nr:PaREP1/PaREP8 domain-containing protein [Methanomicrobia archaeon]